MMNASSIAIFASLASIISIVFSILLGLKNNRRADEKDIEKRVEGDTRINVKLDVITNTTAEIKTELSNMKEDMKGIDRRLVVCEQSIKAMHKRVDTMEDRINEKEN